MRPAIRTQIDELQDDASRASALDCSDLPDLARQEFREEADVNQLLSRYGVNVPVQRVPQFGEIDFDLDLHSAHIAVDRAQQAFNALSPELRSKYKTTRGLLDAMNSGELAEDLTTERDDREKAKAAAQVAQEEAAKAAHLASVAAKAAKAAATPRKAPAGAENAD